MKSQIKINMKTIIAKLHGPSSVLLLILLITITGGSSPASGGALSQVALPSDQGEANALTKSVEIAWSDARGETQKTTAKIVVLPSNGAIWIGRPASHVVAAGDRLVGVHTASGGILVVRVSTNKLSLPASTQTNEVDEAISNHLKSVTGEGIGWLPTDKEVGLREFVGLSALMGLNRADVPCAPTLTGTTLQRSNLVVTMKSAVAKELVVTLDEEMTPLRATVDGVVTFERGIRKPASLQEELREVDRKGLEKR